MSVEGATIIESNYQVDTSDNFQAAQTAETVETNDDMLWGTELTDFVEANEFELVECPWQPGKEMTISDITNNWQYHIESITKENFMSVLAELQQLLAKKKQQIEDEQLNAILDEELEDEGTTDQKESDSKPSDDLAKQSSNTTTPKIEQPTQKTIVNEPHVPETLSVGVPSTDILIAPKPITVTPPPEAPIIATNISNESISINTSTEETLPTPKNDPTKVDKLDNKASIHDTQPMSPVAVLTTAPLDTPQAVKKAPEISEPQETDAPLLLEPTDKPEYYIQDIVTETAEIQTAEYLMPEVFEADVVELQKVETIESGDFTQAEQVMTEIAEATKEISVETAQIVHEILTEVVGISYVYHEEIAEEEHKKEQVEELFAELLETLGIDHTPELIESLSRLALNGHFAVTLENLSGLDEEEEPHKGSLAGKIIQQLAVALTRIKATASQVCGAIGKSALRHYGLSIDASEAYNF